MRIECVVPAGAILGEGPVWDERNGWLWWVDIKAPALHRFEPATGGTRRWDMPAPVGTVALREGGGLIGAFKTGFGLINPESGAVEWLTDPEKDLPGNRFNDGGVDPSGRFWAGSMDDSEQAPSGQLYRYDPDGQVERFAADMVVTNGVDWSRDGRTFYLVDSVERVIHAYDFDPVAGRPGARRTFARLSLEDGYADGLAIDAEDHVWGAHWDGARLTRYRPDGTIERVVEMPVPLVTSCCFGGPDLDVLYVTTASIKPAPLAGGLFAITGLGVKGCPARRFRG